MISTPCLYQFYTKSVYQYDFVMDLTVKIRGYSWQWIIYLPACNLVLILLLLAAIFLSLFEPAFTAHRLVVSELELYCLQVLVSEPEWLLMVAKVSATDMLFSIWDSSPRFWSEAAAVLCICFNCKTLQLSVYQLHPYQDPELHFVSSSKNRDC